MNNWDFRSGEELALASAYLETGFVVCNGEREIINCMKEIVTREACKFVGCKRLQLEEIHTHIEDSKSNDLRLQILKSVWESDAFNRLYFDSCRDIVEMLCGNELAMQKRIGMSVQLPDNANDALPIHADTWNGVSEYELNILVPLVSCKKTASLYILDRKSYDQARIDFPGLLKKSSGGIYECLKDYLTWIEVEYGSFIAFDQSLPHGFCTNRESQTHWSLNCRFKTLFSPYRDKRLGEYFMPITTKACTLAGARYKEPMTWLR